MTDQPRPTGTGIDVADELCKFIQGRVEMGALPENYGVRLHTENGRDTERDALEEAADLVLYLMQRKLEDRDARKYELFGRRIEKIIDEFYVPLCMGCFDTKEHEYWVGRVEQFCKAVYEVQRVLSDVCV